MADMRLGQESSGRWTVSLTNNNDVPNGLVIPVKLRYNGANEVEIDVRKGVSESAVTDWYTAVGVAIDTDLISVSGSATTGDKTYVVTKVNWSVRPVERKYINVSPSSLSIASGAGSTGQFTVDTNVDNFSVSVSNSTHFSVSRNGNVVTVTALSENTGTEERNATVTVSDAAGVAVSAQVSVTQESSGEPTEVDVKVYGTFEQTDETTPGDTYNELILESDSDEIMQNETITVKALYTTFKSPSATRSSRRGAPIGNSPDDVVIAEEDVTDRCAWETDDYVTISIDGTVTNVSQSKMKETATISATYQEKSAEKNVDVEGNKDGSEFWIEIRPKDETPRIPVGQSIQLTLWDCLHDTEDDYVYEEEITRDEWAVWTIEQGMEYATVSHGYVTNINTDEEDKEIVVKASYKFTPDGVDRKRLVMKGTGDSSPRLNISVPSGEPIPRMGGTATIFIDSNLQSWNITVENVSGDTSSDWFDIGSSTGSNSETRRVTAGIWTTQYNKKCRCVRVTVSGEGLESSVVVTQLCATNPSLSPTSFPGPEGGVAKLHISPGGNINTTFRVYTTNGATGVSFDENVDNVRETGGTCVNGDAVPVNVYIKEATNWNSTRFFSFTAEFETISIKKTGTIWQYSTKLKLENSSDAEVMNNIAYNDDTVHELEIYSNVTWEVVEPQEEWIHASKDGDLLKVSFDNNDGGERTGTIQLRAVKKHEYTYEINVRQNGQ